MRWPPSWASPPRRRRGTPTGWPSRRSAMPWPPWWTLRQDRRRRAVPEPSRGGRRWPNRAPRAAAFPRRCRRSRTPCCPCWSAAPRSRPRPGSPTAPCRGNLQRRTPRRRLAHRMAGPAPAARAGPRRRRPPPRTRRRAAGLPRRHAPQPGPVRAAAAQRGRVRRRGAAASAADRPDGKQQLQAVVDKTLQATAAEQAATYRRLLREAVPADRSPTTGWRSCSTPPATSARQPRSRGGSWPPSRILRRTSTEPDGNGDSRG